jgi:hypothetical protein
LINFGATVLQDLECARIAAFLRPLRVPASQPRRGARLTEEQVKAIIKRAHETGKDSIALAQAIQFECQLSQRDVIGEWVPESEPGESDITDGGKKWLRGITWEEIDGSLVLRHPTSRDGEIVKVRLTDFRMVMDEIARLGIRARKGPVIVSERTELPYVAFEFRRQWRIIANACGIPKDVKNMDSRAQDDAED